MVGRNLLNDLVWIVFIIAMPAASAFFVADHTRLISHSNAGILSFRRDIRFGLSQVPLSSSSDGEEGGNIDSNMEFSNIDEPPPSSLSLSNSSSDSAALIELPIDGSVVVLLPAAVIAILGIITSVMVVGSSGDPILAPTEGSDRAVAPPFAVETIMDDSNTRCRGLCGSQQDDLNSMRDFMGKFARENKAAIDTIDTSVDI